MALNDRSLRLMVLALLTMLILMVASHLMLKPAAGKFVARRGLYDRAVTFELSRGTETWKFRRSGHSWELSEPFAYRADSDSISAFLSLLPDAALSEPLSISAKPAAEFGLEDSSSVKIRVLDDRDRRLVEFAAGKQGPEIDSFFCLFKGSEVRLVSGLPQSLVRRDVWEWLNKTAASLPGGPAYVEVRPRGAKAFRIAQDGGIWKFSEQGGAAVALSTSAAADFMLAVMPGLEADALARYEPLPEAEFVVELKPLGPPLPYVLNIGPAANGFRRAIKVGEARVSYLFSADRLDAILRQSARVNPK